MSEQKRKCFKCGKSPITDNVKLFRYPKPAVRNILKCSVWAKYVFPSEEQHLSIPFMKKLYSEHRMLCQDHFVDDVFTDASKTRLTYTACPSDTQRVTMTLPAYFEDPQNENRPHHGPEEPQASTSNAQQRQPMISITNTYKNKHRDQHEQREPQVQPSQHEQCEPQVQPSQHEQPEPQVQPQPSTSQVESKKGLKTNKEKKLYSKCAKYMRSICNMRNRLKKAKNKALLRELTEDNAIKKLSKKLTPAFASLLQGQLRNSNKSTGRRWNKEEKIIALRLFKRSPTCYRLLRRMFSLPSPGTLKALLQRMPFAVGVTQQVLEVLKNYVDSQQPSDNEFILLFDEMSLRKHLQYNKKEDCIEGYQDHGKHGRTSVVASHALVFMLAGIRKRVKQPIAHYFSSSFVTADRLAVLIKEIIGQCIEAGITISATACDMDGVNRRALSILGATVERPYITVQNTEIVTLFDTPHLLKCFRNLFMKYNIECNTNISSGGKTGRGVAKWAHIQEFFNLDQGNPNFVFAPGLTKDHLNPNQKQKMRVKLAAQVLSHTVAAGMYAKISDGTLTQDAAVTANVITSLDKLFDCLNSDNSDLRRGKIHATNMTEKTPHLQLFKEMKNFFKTMKFVGCPRTPPSQEGWIWTINGVERLFKNLKTTHNIRSLATRRLQQDPLENLFGCIRGNCGSNTNPTTGQFIAGLKTAIISNMAHIGTTGNCETDNNVAINNFSTLLSVSQSSQTVHNEGSMEESASSSALSSVLNDTLSSVSFDIEDNAEMQACAYVCGFLIKNIPTVKCDACKTVLLSTEAETNNSILHNFVQYKEYNDLKTSLNYASKNVVLCVEACATITNNFLNENGFKKGLKVKVIEQLKSKVNFNYLKICKTHSDENINFITNSVFHICVKRFCTVKNRLFANEASAAALKRKMNIILHK